jgi:acyl-CoA thioester hydrolase
MSRIKIDLPENFVFETKLKVQIGDINYGGHLGNDAYLRLAHEARLQFLMKNNWSEMDMDGLGLIMTDAVIQFQAEAFHTYVITIEIAVSEVSKMGFELFYRFTTNEKQKQVARIKTGMRFFDYEQKKIAAAAEKTVERLFALCI